MPFVIPNVAGSESLRGGEELESCDAELKEISRLTLRGKMQNYENKELTMDL